MPREPPVTRAMRPAKTAIMVCFLPGRGLGCSPGRSYESTRVIANRRLTSVAFPGPGSYPQESSLWQQPASAYPASSPPREECDAEFPTACVALLDRPCADRRGRCSGEEREESGARLVVAAKTVEPLTFPSSQCG